MGNSAGYDRAVQFAPFDALSGYSAMIAGLKEKTEDRRILSDEAAEALSQRLSETKKGDVVRLKYYDEASKKYRVLAGEVRDIDFVFRTLKIGKKVILFDDIEVLREFHN